MGFADVYFSKQRGFKPFFSGYPSEKLRYAVVIPAYCEPDLINALHSLLNCKHPEGHVEVIVRSGCCKYNPENSSSDFGMDSKTQYPRIQVFTN
jgi:hypothetical protein